jgi:hypothetical protein
MLDNALIHVPDSGSISYYPGAFLFGHEFPSTKSDSISLFNISTTSEATTPKNWTITFKAPLSGIVS